MSVTAPGPTEVLRGMHVEAAPLRLGRGRGASSTQPDAAAARAQEQAAQEEERRRCMEDAARKGHEEGVRAGYEAGMRKGLAAAGAEVQAAMAKAAAEAKEQLDGQCRTLAAIASGLEASLPDTLAAAEDEMVALCFETVCRIAGDAAVNEDAVRSQVRSLVGRVRPGELLAVHVHPRDLEMVRAARGDAGGDTIQWIADPEVRLGGCIVRGQGGGLDARLESILDACKRSLLAVRAQGAREAVVRP